MVSGFYVGKGGQLRGLTWAGFWPLRFLTMMRRASLEILRVPGPPWQRRSRQEQWKLQQSTRRLQIGQQAH